ncbi:HNH endonuclease [Calidithermus chliarophilus]|uniref:HNH endonuclease n=1 Tax=Calidithermus chliarophilus TaxID=52023 RepID=UPI0012F62B60|nr:HNH endonuclease [Calidithermus chliarophilus]
MIWRDAVLDALRRYSARHSTRNINRQSLVDEELSQIVSVTGSAGETPTQTLSRVLQELRDDGFLYFLGNGNYLLANLPIHVEEEDLPDDALDFVIRDNKLMIGNYPTSDQQIIARRRRGQDRIRRATLENYDYRCAFCDVDEPVMLVAGHIARWADQVEGRGDLKNMICMCKFHDALFEGGYFSMTDDYRILKRPKGSSQTINLFLSQTTVFREPSAYPPASQYLLKHRARSGFL